MFFRKGSISLRFLAGPDTAHQRVVVPSDGSSCSSASPWHLPAKKNKYTKVLQNNPTQRNGAVGLVTALSPWQSLFPLCQEPCLAAGHPHCLQPLLSIEHFLHT